MPLQDLRPEWIRALPDLPPWTEQQPAGPWNLRGYLEGWREHPLAMDFLDPESSVHDWKALEDRLYDHALRGELLAPQGDRLRIFDAACGVGRFVRPMLAAGHEVVGLDACWHSVQAAWRHCQAWDPWLLAADVTDLPANLGTFDRVLAMELLCYLDDAEAALAGLVERLRPGGTLIASVEAWPGGLLADPSGVTPERLGGRVVANPGERWVRCFGKAEFAAMLKGAGLTVRRLVGTHYLPDGPLAAVVDLDRLDDPAHCQAIVDAEARLRSDPLCEGFARAWAAVATKP